MLSKETTKTFVLYFLIGAIIILSINTFIQNQQLQSMQKQIDTLQKYIVDNQQILYKNKNMLGNLSQDLH